MSNKTRRRRDKVIAVRMPDVLRRYVESSAKADTQTVSGWIRLALLEKKRREEAASQPAA